MTEYDYTLLRGDIERLGADRFAAELDIGRGRLAHLLSGGSEFRADEIIRIAELLHLDCTEVTAYFFTKKVQKS